MNYQIGIVGAGIIAVYSALVLLLIVWPLGKLLKRFSWRWRVIGPVAFVLLAAPWAEEYWIARNFELACKDAGVHVYKRVEVEGFVDATGTSSRPEKSSAEPKLLYNDAPRLLEWDRDGYGFKEYLLSDGRAWHVERHPDGVYYTVLNRPTARYHYKYAYHPTPYKQEERIGWKLEKLGTIVVDSETGEIIARDTQYRRTINIAEGSWRLFWGLAQTYCDLAPTERLPRAAFKPLTHN
ncbi:MAG: hypothetical protein IPM27_04130 [Nitrosomonadales bacterium]|nr:hypothetical protein [Nitrosomonadales bacterium]